MGRSSVSLGLIIILMQYSANYFHCNKLIIYRSPDFFVLGNLLGQILKLNLGLIQWILKLMFLKEIR